MHASRWLIVGAVAGILMALGHIPFLAGAAHDLAATALALVGSAGHDLVKDAAQAGAPQRIVLGATAVVAVVAPGVTALLAVLAGRGTLRLRAIVAVVLVALGAASFAYHPKGVATGTIVVALAVAGIAVAATGPLVAAPLAALGGLLAGTYLPALVLHARVPRSVAVDLHRAIYSRPGDPFALRVVLVVLAVVPFVVALRAVLRK